MNKLLRSIIRLACYPFVLKYYRRMIIELFVATVFLSSTCSDLWPRAYNHHTELSPHVR
jgi:hypothetical protein